MLEPVWTCGPGGVRVPVGEQPCPAHPLSEPGFPHTVTAPSRARPVQPGPRHSELSLWSERR